MDGGIEPLLRAPVAANDSALLIVLTAVMVANFFCAPTLSRIAGQFFKQLFRTRREALPGEKTIAERIVVALAVGQMLTFEALTLYCACGAAGMPPLASLGGLLILVGALLAVQTVGYALTGYAFADAEQTRLWLSAFMVTQAVAGFMLIIPALGALFYPRLLTLFLCLAGAVFIGCRIPLYIREFRIFYTSSASLVYFFLYLCTLEIVPIIAVLSLAGTFSSLFC